MRVRALGLTVLVAGVAFLPFGAAAGEGLAALDRACEDQMLAELGWLDLAAPEGQAFDPAPVAPPALPLGPRQDLHPCTGVIQPGAQMTSGCTMNFIFRDVQGRLYLGTAGHCTAGAGDTIGIAGVGSNVATVVFDGLPGPIDFTLARIDPAFYSRVDPTMCHWGGPTGVNDAPTRGETTHIYGFGNIYGGSPETRPRPGVLFAASTNEVIYIGMAQPGDSGSPLVSGNGEGLGIHVRSTLSTIQSIRIDPSQKFATRLDRAIQFAEAGTGLDIELVNGLAAFNLLGY